MIAGAVVLYAIVTFVVMAAAPPVGWVMLAPLLLAVAFSGHATRG